MRTQCVPSRVVAVLWFCSAAIHCCYSEISATNSWGNHNRRQHRVANRSVFAENLRRACLRYRTIAEVCEGIGINRQQFNKYLSGAALPNTLTLERICRFLNVTHGSLFSPPEAQPEFMSQQQFAPSALLNFLSPKDQDFDLQVIELPTGNYLVYTPFLPIPGMLVRSLLKIRHTEFGKTFARITKLANHNTKSKPLAQGRHTGPIFASDTEIYLLGRNRYAPRQLSLMALKKSSVYSSVFLTGLVITQTVGLGAALKCCVVAARDVNGPRSLLSSIGLIHESDPKVDPVIWSALK